MNVHYREGGCGRSHHWSRLAGSVLMALLLMALLMGSWMQGVCAQTPEQAQPASDYSRRVVAYLNDNETVSRQQLGDYLIARYGAEKLELLVNRRIIERATRARGVEINAGQVEAAFADDLKDIKIDRERFIRDVLKSYRKNLYEWKEDVLRPKLALAALCRDQIQVDPKEVDEAFDAAYGEKIQCRIILWPKGQEEDAKAEYSALRDSEDAFAVKAKRQARGNLAATGGQIKPIARGSLGLPDVEREAFTLKPGEVSKLLATPEGVAVLKCDQRIPADTTINRDTVRAELEKQVREKKVHQQIPKLFADMRKEANPKTMLPAPGSAEDTPAAREPSVAVATIYGAENITREEFGEFLIARYGPEKVELLVNKIILEMACRDRGVTASPGEIETELDKHLKRLNVNRKVFTDTVLKQQHLTMYEWTEDVLKPTVLLGKLTREKVTVTAEDLQKAFDAYYGEKIKCRLILWPKGEEKHAMLEYAKLRDDESEFDRKARTQASPTLAASGGRVGDNSEIGRCTTGNDELEREAFSLRPGEVSRLIGTPEGTAIVKCDARVPARENVKLDDVRPKLTQDVFERKIRLEMPRVFAELRAAAKPRLMLKNPNKPEELATDVLSEIKELDLKGVPSARQIKK